MEALCVDVLFQSHKNPHTGQYVNTFQHKMQVSFNAKFILFCPDMAHTFLLAVAYLTDAVISHAFSAEHSSGLHQ